MHLILYKSYSLYKLFPKLIAMPKMTKLNAKEMLMRTLEKFKSVTKESVGVIFSWNGGLTVLGSEPFRQYISRQKEDVWGSLALTKTTDYTISKAGRDSEMMALLEENIEKLNVTSLRQLI